MIYHWSLVQFRQCGILRFSFYYFFVEKPENLQIQLDSNTITVKWQLPQSTGHLHKINMQLYDHNADITLTNKTVNGRLTSYTMTIVSPQQCFPHSFKVRCEYKDRGWSDFTKQMFWFPGKFC